MKLLFDKRTSWWKCKYNIWYFCNEELEGVIKVSIVATGIDGKKLNIGQNDKVPYNFRW